MNLLNLVDIDVSNQIINIIRHSVNQIDTWFNQTILHRAFYSKGKEQSLQLLRRFHFPFQFDLSDCRICEIGKEIHFLFVQIMIDFESI